MNGIIEHDHSASATTRRRFLAALGTAGVGALCLSGCSTNNRSSRQVEVPKHPPAPPPVARPALPEVEPMMRVRLLAARPTTTEPVPRAELRSDDGWIRVRPADSARMGVIVQSPLSISREADRWRIVDAGGFEPQFEGLTTIECMPEEGRGSVLMLGTRRIPGVVRLVAVEREAPEASTEESTATAAPGNLPGAFDMVNFVPMETYLPGVLAGELYSHWHIECFHAQAVAARSYAAVEAWYWADRRHFDVTANTASQMYTGETMLKVARQAVERSRGVVLTWNQSVVPAYYSSCCGGVAASAIDEVSPNPINDIPPLRGRSEPNACTSAPVYSWRITRARKETTLRVNAFGSARRDSDLASLGAIDRIEARERSAYGRPTRFAFIDAGGREAGIRSLQLRSSVDFALDTAPASGPRLRSSFVKVSREGESLVFEGRGYGHGVGLCQFGAQALAQRGENAEKILASYYPESVPRSAYA